MSYATNKVVKSAGARLVPYLAHADRVGNAGPAPPRPTSSGKVAETISLWCLVGLGGRRRRRGRWSARGRLEARSRPRGTRSSWGPAGARRQAPLVGGTIAGRMRRLRAPIPCSFGRPRPRPGALAPVTSSHARWADAGRPRATTPLLGTAFFGKLLGCAGLYIVLTGMGHPPRCGDDAVDLHAHDHGCAHRPAPRRHRRGLRAARRAARSPTACLPLRPPVR